MICWLDLVGEERALLAARLTKLRAFVYPTCTEGVDRLKALGSGHISLLIRQEHAMSDYLAVLDERIELGRLQG